MRACNYTELVSITMNGKAKEFSKERFYHYSNVTKIKSILENNEIWLTRLDSTNLNDLDEKDLKYSNRFISGYKKAPVVIMTTETL